MLQEPINPSLIFAAWTSFVSIGLIIWLHIDHHLQEWLNWGGDPHGQYR